MSAAATSSHGRLPAVERTSSPASEQAIPVTSEYGAGRRSVIRPTMGCSTDALTMRVNVMSPTCEKLS